MALLLGFLALLVALSRSVLAHGGLGNYTVGDKWYRGFDPNESHEEQDGQPWMVQRRWDSIDPIFESDDRYIACNKPGTPASTYIPIKAGENITAVYWYWLHPTGPMAVWLAACGESCDNVDVNKLDWFKIWHAGLVDDGSYGLASSMWYQKNFQNWRGDPCLWPVTIPETLRPGKYIIRHEIISIHVAYKPQWYPECAHLEISGTGTALPPSEYYVKFPGAYRKDDPLVYMDIYSDYWTNATNAAKYVPPLGQPWDGFVNKYCVDC